MGMESMPVDNSEATKEPTVETLKPPVVLTKEEVETLGKGAYSEEAAQIRKNKGIEVDSGFIDVDVDGGKKIMDTSMGSGFGKVGTVIAENENFGKWVTDSAPKKPE